MQSALRHATNTGSVSTSADIAMTVSDIGAKFGIGCSLLTSVTLNVSCGSYWYR